MKKLLSLFIIISIVLTLPFAASKAEASKQFKITFLDVGQADSILVQSPDGKNMLIDAGNNEDSTLIINYLKGQNIKKLDYIIGSHPHEDHIGALDSVINKFDIGKVYMPKATTTTKTFEDVIDAIKNKGLKITNPVAGTAFKLGEATCTILAPNSDKYEDLNNYSIVLKLTYKNNSFLFTGDAEDVSEQEMLSKGYDLKADVLKIGHHGSANSSTEPFIKKVNPKYAVISVGKGNTYGHPTKLTLDRLSKFKIPLYRTDLSGAITVTTDGTTIKFDKLATPDKSQAPPSSDLNKKTDTTKSDVTVFITKSGTKYHLGNCSYLKSSKIAIKLKEAKAKGFTPCSKCKPPK